MIGPDYLAEQALKELMPPPEYRQVLNLTAGLVLTKVVKAVKPTTRPKTP